MKRVICLLTILLLIPTPISAVVFETASYIDSGVQVDVSIEASTPWSAPFTEDVNVTIGVTPMSEGVTQTNITSVSLVLYRVEADASGFFLIAADEATSSPLVQGGSTANYTHKFTLSGTAGGLECYFSLLVRGSFGNASTREIYQALSPEDFVGPFVVSTGISSPVALVGLLVIGLSTVVFIAGIYGVKRSRTRRRRKSLMEE